MRAACSIVVVSLSVFLAAGCGKSESVEPPPGAENTALAHGLKVYRSHCAGCHGADGETKMRGVESFTDAKWQTSRTNEDILKAIRDGRGAMPPFKNKLTDQEIADVLAYTRSFAGLAE